MISKKFEKKLERYRSIINETIFQELESRRPKSLYEPIIYFLKGGGKRLRGILLLLVVESLSKKPPKNFLQQAIAIELLHNFTLIHDDIMDNSVKRHNKPTLHVKYDLSTAILSGDVLLSIAYEFLMKNLQVNKPQVIEEFTRALTIVCEGQALDKEFELRKNVTINDYFEMISKKTGALIESICRIGALLTLAERKVIKELGKFGLYLGIAFQLQDDLLDLTGEVKKFGKPKGNDLVEGKKTYIILKALQNARGKYVNEIRKLIEKKGIKPEQVDDFIDMLENLGIFDDTKKEIDKYFNLAMESLQNISNSKNLNNLYQFAHKVLNRDF